MKLLVLAIGHRQPAWADAAWGHFAKRFPPEMRLELVALKAGAGFTIVTNVPATLAAGASASLVVRFDTTVAGVKSAVLSFANNDSNENPYNLILTGTVTVP